MEGWKRGFIAQGQSSEGHKCKLLAAKPAQAGKGEYKGDKGELRASEWGRGPEYLLLAESCPLKFICGIPKTQPSTHIWYVRM